MADTRIYVVTEVDRTGTRQLLVRAATPAQAIRHAAKGRFSAEVCSTDDAIRLAQAGVVVSEAGSE